jgi:DNA-binding IclR family transcriptional regulator
MVALSFDLTVEGATASEVVQDTGVKKGTAHPDLRKLLVDNRLLEQSEHRRYLVPNYAIPRIKSMLSEKKSK